MLNITAIKSIKTYEGFKLSNGGIGNFKCLEDINMGGGNVENESVLKLSGENVLLSNDFSVNLGGELNISY